MPTPEVFRWEFEIPVPPHLLWNYVADTERINRLAGLFPVRYTYTPLESGGSQIQAEAHSAGITLRWIERPCEWVEPELFRFTRDYLSGPFLQMVSQVELRGGAAPGSTHLTHTITVTPRHIFGRLIARFAVGVQTRDGFRKVYALAPEWAAGRELPVTGTEPAPAREHARRELERVLRPLAGRLDAVALGERLSHHLLDRPDSEIASLAPYALADEWKVDRRLLLRLFLHAARAGLLDLEYDLICPSCRRAKVRATRLSEVTKTGHCPTCNISFGVDFERSIEVRFNPHPLGLGHEAAEYCHAGPANTPHRIASWSLPPGGERPAQVQPTRLGKHQFVSPQAPGGVFFEVVDDPDAPSEARIELDDAGIHGVPERLRPPLALQLVNRAALPAELMLARTQWADNIVTAAELAAIQEFRDLFGADLLAPGAEFAIESQVFLFTDVVGSTAMYEKIGDGPAFSLIRRHFDVLAEIYQRHDGALVKTIGDAIMCVFRRGDQALRAAVDMAREVPLACEVEAGVPLHLRIGLHRGPCIAMTANDRIDYFGTTVNTAARIQGVAGADEVAISPSLLHQPDVHAVVTELRLPARTQELTLKGLSGRHMITIFKVDP
jgi:class 3 adenylate cyclase